MVGMLVDPMFDVETYGSLNSAKGVSEKLRLHDFGVIVMDS